jgi:SnoaL-like protein
LDLYARYREIEQLWASQSWEQWAATVAPQYRFDPGVGALRDVDGTLEWSRALFAAFPDLSQSLDQVVVAGRTGVGVATTHGTFAGPLKLGTVVMQPTGRTFQLPYVKVIEFDRDGMQITDRQYMDSNLLLDQILFG